RTSAAKALRLRKPRLEPARRSRAVGSPGASLAGALLLDRVNGFIAVRPSSLWRCWENRTRLATPLTNFAPPFPATGRWARAATVRQLPAAFRATPIFEP